MNAALHGIQLCVKKINSTNKGNVQQRLKLAKLYKHLFLVCGNPISRGKPFVNLDVLYTVLEVSIAFGEVHLEQVTQQVL